MSDLFGNHIVGFPTRRLICVRGKPALSKKLHYTNLISIQNIEVFRVENKMEFNGAELGVAMTEASLAICRKK